MAQESKFFFLFFFFLFFKEVRFISFLSLMKAKQQFERNKHQRGKWVRSEQKNVSWKQCIQHLLSLIFLKDPFVCIRLHRNWIHMNPRSNKLHKRTFKGVRDEGYEVRRKGNKAEMQRRPWFSYVLNYYSELGILFSSCLDSFSVKVWSFDGHF